MGKKIAVFHSFHTDLKGGGEQLAANIIYALDKAGHEVILFGPPASQVKLEELNKRFDIKISSKFKVRESKSSRVLSCFLKMLINHRRTFLLGDIWIFLLKFREAVFLRNIKKIYKEKEFDLIIWTTIEPSLGFFGAEAYNNNLEFDNMLNNNGGPLSLIEGDIKTIKYCHFPHLFVIQNFKYGKFLRDILNKFYELTAGIKISDSLEKKKNIYYFANSEWTSDLLAKNLIDIKKIYPPVQVNKFLKSEKSWDNRDNGFISIGRIEEDKNILRNIEIVRCLHEKGHNIHLHIIGFERDEYYINMIKNEVKNLEYIYYEGEVSYQNLLLLIGSHKYGIHGKDFEHFGIVPAQMAAGGVIPFVPHSGGQVEIVEMNKFLCYKGVEDAVEKIEIVLNSRDIQENIKKELRKGIKRFSRKEFQRVILEEIEYILEQ
jgi:glycosyltransferase involved in cell wall biosynthesis